MFDVSIYNYMIQSLVRFKVEYNVNPILVVGRKTVKDFINRELFPYTEKVDDERAHILTLGGFQVEVGDFDYGFHIE